MSPDAFATAYAIADAADSAAFAADAAESVLEPPSPSFFGGIVITGGVVVVGGVIVVVPLPNRSRYFCRAAAAFNHAISAALAGSMRVPE